MAIQPPSAITVTIDPLPDPPQTSDPTNFDARADAYVLAEQTFSEQVELARQQVNANALVTQNNAQESANSATASAAQVTLAEEQVGLAADQVALAAGQVTLATAQAVIATNKAQAASDTLTLIENIAAGLSFTSHSTTSVAISAGAKTFTVDANESFAEGMPLYIVVAGDPTRYMIGLCTGYAGTSLQVLVSQISAATGTFADWNISLGGIPGAAGPGVAIGGATGQVLRKKSGADYDTEWVAAASMKRAQKTANYTAVQTDLSTVIELTSASALTLSLTAAATLGNGWFAWVQNTGTAAVTIDPNGAETIDTAASTVCLPDQVRLITCDGTAFKSILMRDGGWQLLATSTVSSPVATITFSSIPDTYSDLLFVGDNLIPASANYLYFNFSDGVSWSPNWINYGNGAAANMTFAMFISGYRLGLGSGQLYRKTTPLGTSPTLEDAVSPGSGNTNDFFWRVAPSIKGVRISCGGSININSGIVSMYAR